MINRAKEFLPQIRPSLFTQRGTAGIRSSLIDKQGKFVNDTQIKRNECSLHVLNYNSPGATGALPIAAMIAHELIEQKIVSYSSSKDHNYDSYINDKRLNWDIAALSEEIKR
jgi:L-2-hydroxyglutarate oxidase